MTPLPTILWACVMTSCPLKTSSALVRLFLVHVKQRVHRLRGCLSVLQRERLSNLLVAGCEGCTKLYCYYLRRLHDTFGPRAMCFPVLVVLVNTRHKVNVTEIGLWHRKWNFINLKIFWNITVICFIFVRLQVTRQSIAQIKEVKLLATVLYTKKRRNNVICRAFRNIKDRSRFWTAGTLVRIPLGAWMQALLPFTCVELSLRWADPLPKEYKVFVNRTV
jgi:hypothetical protein